MAVILLADQMPALLDFEAANPKTSGQKNYAIRATFDISPARYYQLLLQLVRDPHLVDTALEYDPTTINRLTRQYQHNAEQRKARQ